MRAVWCAAGGGGGGGLCAAYAEGNSSGDGIPTGQLAPVAGTVHDFTQAPVELGPRIAEIAEVVRHSHSLHSQSIFLSLLHVAAPLPKHQCMHVCVLKTQASPHWPHGEGFVVAGNVGKDSNTVAQQVVADPAVQMNPQAHALSPRVPVQCTFCCYPVRGTEARWVLISRFTRVAHVHTWARSGVGRACTSCSSARPCFGPNNDSADE